MPDVLSYTDPNEGFRGWLVYDRQDSLLYAGGCRVQQGLTVACLRDLAARMTLKQRLLGLNVAGAKCGLDYDPTAPGVTDAIRRFLAYLREELLERYSMGTDMGTRWPQLESAAQALGIPSVKYAAAHAQRLSDVDFFNRIALLDHMVGGLTTQQRRAGTGLAHAVLATATFLEKAPDDLDVAVQGFGTLGRGVAAALTDASIRVIGISDIDSCLADPNGLDIPYLLTASGHVLVTGSAARSPQALLATSADVLVLAAGANALTPAQAAELPVRAVVVGANNGLSNQVEELLEERGVIVIPDLIAGAGSTASIDVIFGSPQCPTPEQVLAYTGDVLGNLTAELLLRAAANQSSMRQAALEQCREHPLRIGDKPYGESPFGRYAQPAGGVETNGLRIDHPSTDPTPVLAACQHERRTIADSTFFGENFTAEESRRLFCDLCRYQRWLDVEAALAAEQAELGIIPPDAAKIIGAKAVLANLDMSLLRRELTRTHHSLVGLLRALQHSCGDAGQWVHYGATTQDIQDTSCAIEMRDTLEALQDRIKAIVSPLATLARAHRNTPMIARTHAQPALPTTFGAKIATWIDELIRSHDRATAARQRVAVIELHGGAGTMAGYGDQALELAAGVARRLQLAMPDTAWHATRDRPVEYTTVMAMAAGAFARIADEIRTLCRPEINEIAVPWTHGVVASSTMPHKRNPDVCEQVVVLARLTASQVTAAFHGLGSDHERDARGYWLEWAYVPDTAHYTLAAADLLHETLQRLSVHPAAMWQRLVEFADRVGTEHLMLQLAPAIGKQAAHTWLYEHSQRAQQSRRSLAALLAAEPDPAVPLDVTTLTEALDPLTHLGHAAHLADHLANQAERLRTSLSPGQAD